MWEKGGWEGGSEESGSGKRLTNSTRPSDRQDSREPPSDTCPRASHWQYLYGYRSTGVNRVVLVAVTLRCLASVGRSMTNQQFPQTTNLTEPLAPPPACALGSRAGEMKDTTASIGARCITGNSTATCIVFAVRATVKERGPSSSPSENKTARWSTFC